MIAKEFYTIDDVARCIENAMHGYALDGMNLPRSARIMCDLLGQMIYQKETVVAVAGMPEEMHRILIDGGVGQSGMEAALTMDDDARMK